MRTDAELRPYGNAGEDDRANGVRKERRGVQLDEVRAAFLHEPDGRAQRRIGALLQRTVRAVAAHERAGDAAPDGLTYQDHLIDRDFQLASVSPEIHADRIAGRDDVDAG